MKASSNYVEKKGFFECDQCHKRFSKMYSFARHLKSHGDIITPYQQVILEALEQHGPLRRGYFNEKDSLMEKTGMPRTTIYDNLIKLQKVHLVEVVLKRNGKRGTPIKVWKLKEGGVTSGN